MVQLAALQRTAQGNAVFVTADADHLPIAGVAFCFQRSDDALGHRVHPQNLGAGIQEGRRLRVHDLFGTFPEPQRQIFKGEDGVHIVVVANIGCFILLGNAGTGKDHFDLLAEALLEKTGMGDHGRDHRSHLIDQVRIIALHQPVERGAAGGDDVLHVVFLNQSVIFRSHISGALGGFRNTVEAQSLQRTYEHLRIGKIEGSEEGRCQRQNDLLPSADEFLHQCQVAGHGFGILGTYIEAGSAQDAGFFHNFCLFIFHFDGLDRT